MCRCAGGSAPAPVCWETQTVLRPLLTGTASAPLPALFLSGEIQHLLRSFRCPRRIQELYEKLCLPVHSVRFALHTVLSIFLSAAPKGGRSHIRYEQPLQQAISGYVHLDYLPLPSIASPTGSNKTRRLTAPFTVQF